MDRVDEQPEAADISLSDEQNRELTKAAHKLFKAQRQETMHKQHSIIYGKQYSLYRGR